MLKVRKGATSSLTISQLQAIIEAIGGKWTSFVGFVAGTRVGDRNAVWADSQSEAEGMVQALKKFEVSSLPSKPKSGVMYVTKLDDVKVAHGDQYEILFDSVTGAEGARVEMPGGKKAEFLPGKYSIQEARDYLKKGPRRESLYPPDVIRWLAKETDWVAQINAFLGVEEHVPADARTRDRTGSCPVCFQNVKIAPERNTVVLHGYKRPGHGSVEGKCFGVGYLPFELSSKGCEEYLEKYLRPQLKVAEAYANSLKADDLESFSLPGSSQRLTRDNPKFEFQLRIAREDSERRVAYIKQDVEAYENLVRHWKERPLPKEGEKHIDWFYAGQKSASAMKVASTIRIAKVAALKLALETKRWGPFVFEIDRPNGFKKEWPQDDGSVKSFVYPVDYGYFVDHTGEDEEGLDAFVGDDPQGKIESFLKMKPSEDGSHLVPDETKFLIGLSDAEREKILDLYEPEMIVGLREYDDVYELISFLNSFRDRAASIRVASRYLEAKSR